MRQKKLKWIFIVLNFQSLQKINGKSDFNSRCVDCNLNKELGDKCEKN